jgi:hypothetical protein
MGSDRSKDNGIKRLIRDCKKQFRIPENLDHYSQRDYLRAEKKFVKYVLRQGGAFSEKD